jgi:hypothetical protein
MAVERGRAASPKRTYDCRTPMADSGHFRTLIADRTLQPGHPPQARHGQADRDAAVVSRRPADGRDRPCFPVEGGDDRRAHRPREEDDRQARIKAFVRVREAFEGKPPPASAQSRVQLAQPARSQADLVKGFAPLSREPFASRSWRPRVGSRPRVSGTLTE